jgi:hypothetical protein
MCWQPVEQLATVALCILMEPSHSGRQARARNSCAGNLRNCGDAVHGHAFFVLSVSYVLQHCSVDVVFADSSMESV